MENLTKNLGVQIMTFAGATYTSDRDIVLSRENISFKDGYGIYRESVKFKKENRLGCQGFRRFYSSLIVDENLNVIVPFQYPIESIQNYGNGNFLLLRKIDVSCDYENKHIYKTTCIRIDGNKVSLINQFDAYHLHEIEPGILYLENHKVYDIKKGDFIAPEFDSIELFQTYGKKKIACAHMILSGSVDNYNEYVSNKVDIIGYVDTLGKLCSPLVAYPSIPMIQEICDQVNNRVLNLSDARDAILTYLKKQEQESRNLLEQQKDSVLNRKIE